MRGLDESGQFFLCTETSPRCYVIQQVNETNIDGTNLTKSPSLEMETLKTGNLAVSNTKPVASFPDDDFLSIISVLPWWFNIEVRRQLLQVQSPALHFAEGYEPAATPERPPSSVSGGDLLAPEEYLKAKLKRQLEYYFSRENLINDRYLRSQMDSDQYVPIKIIASFPKITQLTNEFDLIVEVLKNSTQLQVDETGEKVRAITKRCTIILRGIPENADEEEVKSMFNGCPPYKSLTYGLNDSWYVTFSTEDETRRAFVHLQNLGKCFNGKPVYARIKAGGAPIGSDIHSEHKYSPELRGHITIHHEAQIVGGGGRPSSSDTNRGQSPISSNTLSNLGQILSQYGYVPRATFRPSIPIPPPMITMTGPAAMFQPFHSSPGSFFSQPIISSAMNGGCSFATAMENCNGAEHSGSSRFETSSNSTIGAGVPRVGKQRITDIPRINRNDRRSQIYYQHNDIGQQQRQQNHGSGYKKYGANRIQQQKNKQQQQFDENNFTLDTFEENMGGMTDEQHNKSFHINNSNSFHHYGKQMKLNSYHHRQSLDGGIGKPMRLSKFAGDRFKDRRNSQVKPMSSWRIPREGGYIHQPLNSRLNPRYGDGRKGSAGRGSHGGLYGGGNKYQTISSFPEVMAPSPVSWRQGTSSIKAPTNTTEQQQQHQLSISSVSVNNTSSGFSGDDSMTSGSRRHSYQQNNVALTQSLPPPQPLIQKPKPLSQSTAQKPSGGSFQPGSSKPLPLGHSRVLIGVGGAPTGYQQKAFLNSSGGGGQVPALNFRRNTTSAASSSNYRRFGRKELGYGGDSDGKQSDYQHHQIDGRTVDGVSSNTTRADFNFVEMEFPSLERGVPSTEQRKSSLKSITVDCNGTIAEGGGSGKSKSRVKFSTIVASGRRRASSSEVEPIANKHNFMQLDALIDAT